MYIASKIHSQDVDVFDENNYNLKTGTLSWSITKSINYF